MSNVAVAIPKRRVFDLPCTAVLSRCTKLRIRRLHLIWFIGTGLFLVD